MSSTLQAALIGASFGGLLTTTAYFVQGGTSWSFAVIGAVEGAFIAISYSLGLIRLPVVCAAICAIGSLIFAQVPTCDGSHFTVPILGSLIGAAVGYAIPKSHIEF